MPLNASDRAGISIAGKTSFTVDQAAAQLDRAGVSWATHLGAAATVTYAYRADSPSVLPDDVGAFSRLTPAQIAGAELALVAWSDVANITFHRVGEGVTGSQAYSNNATILISNYGTGEPGAAAFTYFPGSRASSSIDGDVWIASTDSDNLSPLPGSYGLETLTHEFGHAIGLSHPSDYDAGDSASTDPTYARDAKYYEDTREYSIMSYFASSNTGGSAEIFAVAPQLDDIAAAQRLYGANFSTRTGDDVYGFHSNLASDGGARPWYTLSSANDHIYAAIWDSAGNDTLDFSGYSQNQLIDLREGNFSNVGGDVGNVAIAVGAKIENAISGSGDDTLIGNSLDNHLYGGPGDDRLEAHGGRDTLDGGPGRDTGVVDEPLANEQITRTANYIDLNGSDGAALLISIESIQFSDGLLSLDSSDQGIDPLYFYQRYPTLFASAADPAQAYNSSGWKAGQDPDPFFSTNGYLGANPDVKAAGGSPLLHYESFGWHEGRDPSANFDTTLYLLHNPDVAAAGLDPLIHYLQFGRFEGRQNYPAVGTKIDVSGFDGEFYLLSNPDVAAAGTDPLSHYLNYGWKEGRNPNAFFDDSGYLAAYPDVADAGINPLLHFDQFGWREGRDPSGSFDTLGYEQNNADVAAAGINPLVHFLTNGIYEFRSPMSDGLFHH